MRRRALEAAAAPGGPAVGGASCCRRRAQGRRQLGLLSPQERTERSSTPLRDTQSTCSLRSAVPRCLVARVTRTDSVRRCARTWPGRGLMPQRRDETVVQLQLPQHRQHLRPACAGCRTPPLVAPRAGRARLSKRAKVLLRGVGHHLQPRDPCQVLRTHAASARLSAP